MDYLLHAHPVAWIALIPVWAFFLRLLAGLFQVDIPSWPRALTNVILTGAAVFFVYDGAGFAFLSMFGEKFVEFPANYGYSRWMLESPLLKWEVLGLVPAIRWLPILFALCVGGTFQVLILVIPFRVGTLLFVVHWGANLVALALVGFVTMLIVPEPSPSSSARSSGLRLKAHPDLDPATLKGILANMVPTTAPDLKTLGKTPDKTPETKKKDVEPSKPLEDAPPSATVQTLLKDMEPQLDSLKRSSAPLLSRLPGFEDYLNRGGWWVVLGFLTLLSLCWIVSAVRRVRQLTTLNNKD